MQHEVPKLRTSKSARTRVLRQVRSHANPICIADLVDHTEYPPGSPIRGYHPDYPQNSTGYKTVGQALNDLVDMGFLRKERRIGPMGKSRMYYWIRELN